MAQAVYEFILGNAGKYQDIIIDEVLSTDTVRLQNKEIVSLIGVRANKVPKSKKKPDRDRFGFEIKEHVSPLLGVDEKAFAFVKELLEGKHIRLEFDVEKKDDNHRTTAYLFLLENDMFVNFEILRQGYAHLQIKVPNTKYAENLREAYQEARKEKRGFLGN